MFELIPQIIITISIAGIIVLVARKLPQISSLPEDKKTLDMNGSNQKFKVPSIFRKILAKIKSFKRSKFLHDLLDLFEKLLRKAKVVFLKIENKITDWAEKIKQRSQQVKDRRKGIEVQVNHVTRDDEVKFTNIQQQGRLRSSSYGVPMEEIEQKYIDAISSNPRDIAVYKKLGKLYQEHGNMEDAKEVYKAILKIDPNDEEGKNQLTIIS